MFLPVLAAAIAVVGLSGCASQEEPAAPASQQAPDADHDHDHGDHADHDHEAGEIAEAMAKLSDEDRAAAEKQKTCPVGDGPLGGMGTPVKVTVKGREVFLCCQGCEEEILSNPDKYLAKLDE
jgi:Cu(I)/Ag(I) efflux system membrane fusion protein